LEFLALQDLAFADWNDPEAEEAFRDLRVPGDNGSAFPAS
jgi:hypothetical protein